MPSMPESMAARMRTRRVSLGAFMVSFSMQLINTMPGPRLAFMVACTWRLVASASSPKSNWTTDLSELSMLYL
jgi:hypothetical protein